MSVDEPRPGTMGSLDRRVERLEAGFADLATDMRLIKQEQSHGRELMELHFKTMDQSNAAMLAEIRLIGQRFETAMSQGAAAAAEPTATPAGRSILERVSTIERDKVAEHLALDERLDVVEGKTDGIEKRVYMALGAAALAVLFIQLIVPFLLQHI